MTELPTPPEPLHIFAGMDPKTHLQFAQQVATPQLIADEIEKELLEPSHQLLWDLLDLLQNVPELDYDHVYENLMKVPEPIVRTAFRFKRKGISGNISGYQEEIKVSEVDNANASNSLSINRKFVPKSDATNDRRYLPFQPGGIVQQQLQKKDELNLLHRNEAGLFDIPQGLLRGLLVGGDGKFDDNHHKIKELLSSLDTANVETELESESIDTVNNSNRLELGGVADSGSSNNALPFTSDQIEGLLPADLGSFRQKFDEIPEIKQTWAHNVDLDHNLENFHELVPNMARTWPFELDTFQKEAVYHLEQGDSVFVAAHTSAGKTVVAEYAIAMAARNMTKAIYTSPIKALLNQKFRDFKETFKDIDIGLITGDVQINPEANCLIMTTEILRLMLYRGADLIRDVEFVIFDEVHYVNDIDRGVVWEEVIIMLPDHVKYVLLSATVPNTFEFANWVGRTKQKDVYVILTPKRPVPLEIFIWAKQNLFKVVDAQRRFNQLEFNKHKDTLEVSKKPPNVTMGAGSRGGRGGTARGGNRGGNRGSNRGGGSGGGGNQRFGRDGPNKNTWLQLVQYLKGNNLLPAVIFVFSKKKCEEYAATLRSVDFCSAKEKSEIHMFIDRAVLRLKREDRELPQILSIREMLGRGIAVHHGGLLPIVKECIEILFAKTLVKVLFATETFAMGLNLPTRTVVFNEARKHDGRGFRNLLPGEFTQMSGRAGRRGLDKTGTVIIMSYNEPLLISDVKEVTLGTPTKLISQFRLTYNMILNLLRIEALRVEEMIKHSFLENLTQTLLPEHQKKVDSLVEELKTFHIHECPHCSISEADELFQLMKKYQQTYGQMAIEMLKTAIAKSTLLKTGRSILYREESTGSLKIGFVLRPVHSTNSVMVLTVNSGDFEKKSKETHLPYLPIRKYLSTHFDALTQVTDFLFERVSYGNIEFIGRYCLKVLLSEIVRNNQDAIKEATRQITVLGKFMYKWVELNNLKGAQIQLHEILEKKRGLLNQIEANKSFQCPNFETHFKEHFAQDSIKTQISELRKLLLDENLELLPDYEQRLSVLEELGFIDYNQNVVLKGRVACEINLGWELVLTELVLDNFLGDFEPEEIVALLSCFVYEGRTNEEEDPCITPRLEKGKLKILLITEKVLKICSDKQVLLTTDEEEFLERKRFALVNVVYEWARGMSFREIMEMSVEPEGTIVRVITRLDEVCREVRNAAVIVGDSALHAKMSEAQERIKRDIVFCASLYL